MPDFSIKQGDRLPMLTDQLRYSNGTFVNLEEATVSFVMRAMTANEPVRLTGTTAITYAPEGKISYTFSAADTAVPGSYQASWLVTLPGGRPMTFPTVGYIWIQVEESLTTPGGRSLVPLPEVKDYLSIPAHDRVQDAKLMRFIDAVRPLVENIVGPILPTVYDEIHDGGQYFVSLGRKPRRGYGSTPILSLISVTEYRGPQPYPLKIIQDPAHGDIYSCMLDARAGTVTRRTTGGGVIAFPAMAQAVRVIYEAGQATVPPNVVEAALEILRVNYQWTQATRRAMLPGSGEVSEEGPPMGFFIPRRARELLAPHRRHPSIF